MRLDLGDLILRPLVADDATPLATLANDREISRHLRDGFPHPYTLEHAQAFIAQHAAQKEAWVFGIEVDGGIAGACGIHPRTDLVRGAELGYWLGRPFHGRGLGTRAVAGLCAIGFDELQLDRLQACVYASNPASARVLEKNRFVREGPLCNVHKDGQPIDSWLYARLRSGQAPAGPPTTCCSP